MSHFKIPVTTQSNSRYGGSSFYSNTSANTSMQKSQLNYSANTSLNVTASGASKLYATKSKKIPSRNSWNHTFSIPINCGKSNYDIDDPELKLFCDPHVNKLQTGNNRRIYCGGLSWDIHIHPNQGEKGNEFALSCFPVQTTADDKLPENYKLKYTISTSLNHRASPQIGQMNDDEKSISKFDAKWQREISHIVYDANPSDITSSKYRQDIDWKSTMERLPFSTNDLVQYNCDEDNEYFNLNVLIKTEFIRKPTKRSQYVGVLGAILLESELKLDQQRKEIKQLNEKKDKYTVTLQQQLQNANKLNFQLTNSMDQMAQNVDKYGSEIHELRKELQNIANRNAATLKQKEKRINDLQHDLTQKQLEISNLVNQVNKVKETHSTNASLLSAFQNMQLQAVQQQQQQQILQQQREQQQRQFSQQLAAQQNIHQSVQQQNAMNHLANNQFAKPQVFSQGASNNFNNAFSSQQPQQQQAPQQSHTAPPNMTSLVADQSPQSTTLSQQSPSYHARVVSQPSFNTNTNVSSSYQAPSGRMTTSPPQMHSANTESNTESFSFGSISPNKNELQMPDLERTEEKKQQKEQSKMTRTPEQRNKSAVNVSTLSDVQPTTGQRISDPSAVETNEIIITDVIDAAVEEEIFQHRPVKAWRWDKDQEKWRGRGKGQLTIYLHKTKNVGKIVFVDEKHQKTRLLQYIDGETHCEFTTEKKSEIEWNGGDYTMDAINPMVGKWKLNMLDPDGDSAAQQFVNYFNDCIDAYGSDKYNEADDNKESPSSTKPFSFEVDGGGNKHESFVNDDSFAFGSALDTQTATSWANTFKQSDESNNNNTSTTMDSGSFANMNWNFNAPQTETTQLAVTAQEVTETTNNKTENKNNDEDNCNYTLKPIVQLEETTVDTGHEHETLITEVPFVKLYRFGKDVTQDPCWKIRASKSKVNFYKSNENGKVRIIARENETNKLRMNQFVPKSEVAAFELRQNKVYQWKAYDSSIAAEEQDDSAGFTLWCIKFENTDYAESFAKEFKEAMKINDSLSGADNEAQQSTVIVDKITSNEEEVDTNAITQNHVQPTQNDVNQDENDEDRYKGWQEEEIIIDKQRRAKAKADEKTAKLFASSGDTENQVSSWDMPNNLFSNNTVAAGNNAFANYDFESQRGVDLEAEKIMNKIQPVTNMSFGVGAASGNDADVSENTVQDFSNVTTRGNNNTDGDDNDAQQKSGLGLADFSFQSGDTGDAEEPNTNFVADWGGGFSSVEVTEGFGNVTWGNDANGGGFGSFDSNNTFNIDALMSDTKRTDATEITDQNATNKDATDFSIKTVDKVANDTDDNCNYTLKPIVSLEEVEVETGHQNEKIMEEFEILKLYRWGKDVSGAPCWKNRASKTSLQCYQNNDSGKIRIVCRENITNKLRLNQLIAPPNTAKLQKKTEKQIQWSGFDVTIEEEDQDDKKGYCLFIAKFADEETATKFYTLFTSSSENNASIAGKP